MERAHLVAIPCRRAAQACGAFVVVIGGAVLAGWATNDPVLLGLRASYIPMAPNSALAFIVLGLGLFLSVAGSRWGSRLAGFGAGLVVIVGILRLSEFLGGAGFGVDQWFIRVPGGRFGLAPIGKMSLATASAFVTAGAAVLVLAWPKRSTASGHVAGLCGVGTAMTGLVFGLGYLFSPNALLLYGTESDPDGTQHGGSVSLAWAWGSQPLQGLLRFRSKACPAHRSGRVCSGRFSRSSRGPWAWSPGSRIT